MEGHLVKPRVNWLAYTSEPSGVMGMWGTQSSVATSSPAHLGQGVMKANAGPPQNTRNPSQQLPVPLCNSVPDPPNILPALKASSIEEGLLYAIRVVYV